MKNLTLTLALSAGLLTTACGSDDKDNTPAKGPGASLKCSGGKNAFDTYGVDKFVKVNEQIFTNVVGELNDTSKGTKNLGTSFNAAAGSPTKLAAFKGNLAAFLVYAYGGPAEITYTDDVKYTGPQDMAQKHAGLNITAAQYDYFLTSIIVPALTTVGVSSEDVGSCFAPTLIDASFKASVINK